MPVELAARPIDKRSNGKPLHTASNRELRRIIKSLNLTVEMCLEERHENFKQLSAVSTENTQNKILAGTWQNDIQILKEQLKKTEDARDRAGDNIINMGNTINEQARHLDELRKMNAALISKLDAFVAMAKII